MTEAEFIAAYREERQAQIVAEWNTTREALRQYQADCLRSWAGRTDHASEQERAA